MKRLNQDGDLEPNVTDVLYRLSNLGVDMVSALLEEIMGVRLSSSRSQVIPISLDSTALKHQKSEGVSLGILMMMEKDVGGVVLLLLEKGFISDVVYTMTGQVCNDVQLLEDEDSLSAIQEFSNIMAAAYTNAIGRSTGIRIFLSPVMVGIDALISYFYAQISLHYSRAICVDTSFSLTSPKGHQSKATGHIIMMPDEPSLQKLIEQLSL